MHFVHKHPRLFAVLAVISTTALFLIGNGMNPVWPLMWIAPIPVLLLAAEADSWWVAGTVAALSMLLGSLTMLYYLHFVLQAPVTAWLIPFSIASVLFSVGVLLFRGLLRRGADFSAVIAIPAFWSVCEYLASLVPANGTAGSLSYTQERFLPILQVASLTGPWGITFLLLLFPSAIASALYLWCRRPVRAKLVLGSALAVLVSVILFGTVRLAKPKPQQTIKVGLLDTDTVFIAGEEPAMQELTKSYAAQAERLAGQGAKIIVMPEKIGVLLDRDAKTIDPIMQPVADHTGATLVLGVLHVVTPDRFNEARIYRPGQPVAMYHKFHMLPPFESNLKPGTSLMLLPGAATPIGVAICKDMDFIHPALDYGRAGVGLILDPAWDFKVDRTWHGHIAIMRGVEDGYAIVHASKFGFLTVTDDRGRVLGEVRTDSGPFASLVMDVPLHHDETVFDRYGTWFPWMNGILLLAVIARLLAVSGVVRVVIHSDHESDAHRSTQEAG
jgi:apolipoprotein N-acyltransferase